MRHPDILRFGGRLNLDISVCGADENCGGFQEFNLFLGNVANGAGRDSKQGLKLLRGNLFQRNIGNLEHVIT